MMNIFTVGARRRTRTHEHTRISFRLLVIFFQLQAISNNVAHAFSSSPLSSNANANVNTNASASASASGKNGRSKSYDLVVVGGGSAGLTAAKFAATFGKSAVIIEKARMGGDCTWTGCIPSKSLLASSKVANTVKKASTFGIHVEGGGDEVKGKGIRTTSSVSVDMKAVKKRIMDNIDHIYQEDDSPEVLKKMGVDVITAAASFVDFKTVALSDSGSGSGGGNCDEVCANDGILIATGASPKPPEIPGLDEVEYITYEQIFDLEEVPSTMTVVGGGPIGCELAQAYSRFGAKVTIIASNLLPREEPEVSEMLQRVFESEGITVTNSPLEMIRQDEDASVSGKKAHVATCKDGQEVSGELLLVAVGRKPVVTGMGLEDLGVELNEVGGIQVDDTLQTSVKGLYAAGDCTGDRQFTHYAGYQGAIGARNILLPLTDPGVIQNVAATTFTDPEVATVGLTEQEARDEFGDGRVAVAFQNISETDRGICEGITEGFIKIIYKKRGYQILGATICSPVAGELIAEISVAMKAGLSFDMLANVIHTYPSHSLVIQTMAAEVYYDKLSKSKGLYNFLKRIGL